MLVLIAGQGRLPGYLANRLETERTPFRIAELDGFPMEGAGAHPIMRFRIETLGSFLAEIAAMGAGEVCFAGEVRRPPLDPAAVDAATMPLVPRMMAALQAGDDAALRTVIAFFEEAGLNVRAAHEIAPDLLPDPGIPTRVQPTDQDARDAARGAEILAAMGAADVGQACIVAHGQALAIEALPGTDAMLAALAAQRASLPMPDGGLLCKAPKPGQDRRIDLPVVGPETVARAAEAGLTGLVVQAGGVMLLDPKATIAAANAAGLLLWVRPA